MSPSKGTETDTFTKKNREEARLVFLEKLAGQAQDQFIQLASRQDAMEDDIKTIKETVVETKTYIEAREERCANHFQGIQGNTKRIGVLTTQVADVECKTWPTVLKIITIYTGAMTLGGALVIGFLHMLKVI